MDGELEWDAGRAEGTLKLLLIDTCGQDGTVAFADTDLAYPVAEMVVMAGRTTSERLIPAVRQLMASRGCRLGELGGIGVVSGPGSFTGVRVGLTAAKGLCESAGLPLVMVSRLLVLANKSRCGAATIHAVLAAGRGEFFYGRIEPGKAPVEALLTKDAVLAAVRGGGTVVVGEEEIRESLGELEPEMVEPLNAADALPLVEKRVQDAAFDDLEVSDANYLRRSDLEMLARMRERVAGV